MSGLYNYALILLTSWFVLIAGPVLSRDNESVKNETANLTPEIFADGVISNAGYRLHGFPTFSPDGSEVFWSVVPPQILSARLTDSGWTSAEPPSYLAGKFMAPFVSPDGHRIYFQAALPGGGGSVDIWYVEREGGGPNEFKNPGQPPNSGKMESQPSLARNDNLYFTGTLEGTAFNRGIFVSRFIDGRYAEPELLPDNINTTAIDYTPFIAPDESFLLFASSRPGTEEKDIRLYVSFRDSDGNWGDPVNLSEKLGLEQSARFPSLTPDGRYLIYLSGDGNFYRVSSEIIERSRPAIKTSAEKCELSRLNRGCSR